MRHPFMICLFVAALPAVSLADGDCPDRPATAPERAVYAAAHAAAGAAVPPQPQHWLMKDESSAKGGERMPECPGGARDAPYRYRFPFRYRYDAAAMAQAGQAAAADALKGTAAQQSRLAVLDKEHDELVAARKQARRSGDQAAVDRVKDRLDRIRAERNTVQEEINNAYLARVRSGEPGNEMAAAVPVRRDAEVVVHINEDKVWAPMPTTEAVNIAGAPHAYWRSNDRGSLVILLGTWNRDSSMFRATLTRSPVITKPRSVVVEIAAERQMAEKLAQEMNLDVLKAQIE